MDRLDQKPDKFAALVAHTVHTRLTNKLAKKVNQPNPSWGRCRIYADDFALFFWLVAIGHTQIKQSSWRLLAHFRTRFNLYCT